MAEFGQKFRKAREAKELSFDDVSNVIKIGPKMLRAIEDENFDQLPGGVFNKGFIRAYAKQLGLNPEEAIAEYLARLREIQQARIEAQQAAWQPEPKPEKAPSTKAPATTKRQASVMVAPPPPVKPPATMQPPRAAHPPRTAAPRPPIDIPWRIVVVALVVVILGILLWTRPRALNMAGIKPSGAIHPAPSDSSGSTATKPQAPPAPSPVQSTPTAQSSQQAPPTGTDASANEEKNDVTVRNFDTPALKTPAAPTTPAAGSFTLIVRASENSWVSVTADGQLVAQETLIAPAHPSFHASREFVVKVGNAAAISFVVNGKEIGPQGGQSEVRTLVFDNSGLKSSPATSN
jgi:cytoskeleton protein RodZ